MPGVLLNPSQRRRAARSDPIMCSQKRGDKRDPFTGIGRVPTSRSLYYYCTPISIVIVARVLGSVGLSVALNGFCWMRRELKSGPAGSQPGRL